MARLRYRRRRKLVRKTWQSRRSWLCPANQSFQEGPKWYPFAVMPKMMRYRWNNPAMYSREGNTWFPPSLYGQLCSGRVVIKRSHRRTRRWPGGYRISRGASDKLMYWFQKKRHRLHRKVSG